MAINDKTKGKPEGWKKGSFVVTVQTDQGEEIEVLSFLGMARPFTPLRECEVEIAVLEALE